MTYRHQARLGAESLALTVTKNRDSVTCLLHILCISLLIVGIILLINPFRSVLLGDDSIYVRTVQRLSERGILRLSPAITPAFVFQDFWGWLFTLPFGFSISAVISSVPPLALLGLLAFYWTLVTMCQSRSVALLGTLAILTSPLYTRLLASFMTDVPFLSLMLISVYFYVSALKSGGKRELFLGSVGMSFALLTRQVGIGIAAAIFSALLYRTLSTRRVPWSDLAAALLLPMLTFLGYQFWLHYSKGETWEQGYIVSHVTTDFFRQWQLPLRLAYDLARYSVFMVLLLIPFFTARSRRVAECFRAALAHPFQLGVLIGVALILDRAFSPPGAPLFWLEGVLYWMGLKFARGIWAPIALLLLISGIALAKSELGQLLKRAANGSLKSEAFFLVTLITIFLIMSSLLPGQYRSDRYVLPIFPLVGLLWLSHSNGQPAKIHLPVIVMIISLALGVWATRFNYDVAEIQWEEADRLVASGVRREDIRGNWGWEGWHFWDPCLELMIASGQARTAKLDCWQSNASTPYKIKLYSVLGRTIRDVDYGYIVTRFIPLQTFWIPAQVAVMVNRASLPPAQRELI